jgi:hypothetical protein
MIKIAVTIQRRADISLSKDLRNEKAGFPKRLAHLFLGVVFNGITYKKN